MNKSEHDKNRFINYVQDWIVELAKESGLDISGYKHKITHEFEIHALKEHGNEQIEKSRGQLPITQEILNELEDVVKNPDFAITGVKRLNKYKKWDDRIILVKNTEHGTILFEEILSGKKNKALNAKSIIIKKDLITEEKLKNILKNNKKNDISNFKIKYADAAEAISAVHSTQIVDGRSQPDPRFSTDESISQTYDKSIIQESTQSNNNVEIAERAQFVQNKLSEAGIEVVADKNEFDAIISEKADGKKMTQGSKIYGFSYQGKIYLNPEIATSETPLHEYTHLWDNYIQNTNPELWEKGKNILRNTKFWEEVKADPNYAKIAEDEDLLLSEVHAQICGKMADAILTKIQEQDGELTKNTVIDWNNETWAYIVQKFGLENLWNNETKETLENLKEFLSRPMKDLFENTEKLNINIPRLSETERQQQAVREMYHDTEMWLKAPNGNPTNLTEEQWVAVRTPNFKRWFGNWDYDANKKIAVTEIDVKDLPFDYKDSKSVKEWLSENLSGKQISIDSDGMLVGFTNRGLKDSLKRRGEEQRAVYTKLEYVIKNAAFFDFENEDRKKKHFYLKGQDVYYSAIKIGNYFYSVKLKLDVNKASLNSYYKDHKVTEIKIAPIAIQTEAQKRTSARKGAEKVSAVSPAAPDESVTGTDVSLSDTYVTIGQLTGGVKPSFSKMIDENGEPLVVYHGSDKQFDVFHTEKSPAFFSQTKDYAESMAEERNGNELYATFLNIRNSDVIELPENEFSDPVIEKPFIENAKLQGKDGIIFTCKTDNELLKDSFYAVFKPNQIKSATDNNGNFDFKNDSILFHIIGEKGAAELDKTEEATTRLDNLKIAQKMTEAGKDEKTIRLATGWERGADGNWRYEIDDSKVNFYEEDRFPKRHLEEDEEFKKIDKAIKESGYDFEKINIQDKQYWESYIDSENEYVRQFIDFEDGKEIWKKTADLERVLNAPELFKAYPELKHIQFKIEKLSSGTSGEYRPDTNTIVLDGSAGKSVLLHEIQHAIQHIEGFATGGNEAQFKAINTEELENKRTEINKKIVELEIKYFSTEEWLELDKKLSNISGEEYKNAKRETVVSQIENLFANKEDSTEYKNLCAELDSLNDRIEEIKENALDGQVEIDGNLYANEYEAYRSLSGEVEARNVQTRMNMTLKERLNTPLSETEDVAQEDQIVMFDGTVAAAEIFEPKGVEKFSEQIDAWQNRQLERGSVVHIGKTSPVLEAVGVPDFEVIIAQDTLNKITRDENIYFAGSYGKGLSIEQVKKIPELLANPVMVFKSASQAGAFVLVSNDTDSKNRTIVAAIHTDKYYKRMVVNEIAGMYGKDSDSWFLKQIDEGRLVYIDKKRSLDWAAERGLQLSPTATNPNFNKNLITKDDFVNNLAQNTTKTGEEKTMDMDQEIERMQANGGMSKAAMEADIRAEEERAYQEWEEMLEDNQKAEEIIEENKNIIVSGTTGSVKTTMINEILQKMEKSEAEIEKTPQSQAATTFLLEKLKNAGIEVITDESQMKAILDAGKEVQKMAAHYGTNQDIQDENSFSGYGVYVLSVNKENAKDLGLKIASKKYGNSFYINNQPLREFLAEKNFSPYWTKLLEQSKSTVTDLLFHEIASSDVKGNITLEKEQAQLATLCNLNLITYKREQTYLYSVEIPDSNGTNYLLYDKTIGLENANRINTELKQLGSTWNVSRNDTGKNVYFNLLSEKIFSSQKKASEFLQKMGYVGMETSGGNYIIFDDREMIINNRAQFMMTESGEVYGFAYNGKIYADKELMNSNVLAHEYTHLWDNYTRKENPELWEKGKAVFKQTHLWEEVRNDPSYQNIRNDEDEILSECHARICGEIAQKVLENIAERDGKGIRADVIDWDQEVSSYIAKELMINPELGNENYLSETIKSEYLKAFISMPMKNLMNGMGFDRVKENISLNEELQNELQIQASRKNEFGFEKTPEANIETLSTLLDQAKIEREEVNLYGTEGGKLIYDFKDNIDAFCKLTGLDKEPYLAQSKGEPFIAEIHVRKNSEGKLLAEALLPDLNSTNLRLIHLDTILKSNGKEYSSELNNLLENRLMNKPEEKLPVQEESKLNEEATVQKLVKSADHTIEQSTEATVKPTLEPASQEEAATVVQTETAALPETKTSKTAAISEESHVSKEANVQEIKSLKGIFDGMMKTAVERGDIGEESPAEKAISASEAASRSVSSQSQSQKASSEQKKAQPVNFIKKGAKDFLSAVEKGTAPFFDKTHEDFGKIRISPVLIADSQTGRAFKNEVQLLAQIYYTEQEMKGQIVTSFEGAKEAGTFVSNKQEAKKNFVLANTAHIQDENTVSITRYFSPEACQDANKIYQAYLNNARAAKIQELRNLEEHFRYIPNGQKEIQMVLQNLAHEHLNNIINNFQVPDGHIIGKDSKEIQKIKESLQNYFALIPENEKVVFQETYGVIIDVQSWYKQGSVPEKLVREADAKLTDFIRSNIFPESEVTRRMREEYDKSFEGERKAGRMIKIDASGIKEPETYLAKYLLACRLNADFITDGETMDAVQKKLATKLKENFRLEKYEVIKEIGMQAGILCDKEMKKMSFDMAHSHEKKQKLVMNQAKEHPPLGMGGK